MGSSGFSWWGGLLSCGLKLGANGMGSVPLPMRHNTTLLRPLAASARANLSAAGLASAQDALFASHVPTVRRLWLEYASCRARPACARRELCALRHVTNACWLRSGLLDDLLEHRHEHRVQPATVQAIHDPSSGPALVDRLAGLWQWRRPPVEEMLNDTGTPRRVIRAPKRVVAAVPLKPLPEDAHREQQGQRAGNLGAWAELGLAKCSNGEPRGREQRGSAMGSTRPRHAAAGVDVGCAHALWREYLDVTRARIVETLNGSSCS